MPHTGTSTLHALLLILGCCLATHNHPTGFNSRDAQALDRTCGSTGGDGSANASISPACASALLNESRNWQCLSDNPWAQHWRLLVAASPARTRFVLTRFTDPLQFGISRLMGGLPERRVQSAVANWAPGGRLDSLIRARAAAYHAHVRSVRAALGHSRWYTEVCWGCGDNASTLVEKLRLASRIPSASGRGDADDAHPMHLSRREDLPSTPTQKAATAERHRLGRLLRERLLRSGAACTRTTRWMCEA
jgi:hypothetical protein